MRRKREKISEDYGLKNKLQVTGPPRHDAIYDKAGIGTQHKIHSVILLTFNRGGIMKRTVLVVLMALVFATPCFAQEVEPDGLFSIEGTRWRTCGISATIELLGFQGFNFNIGCSRTSYGFYEGKVYSCNALNFCLPQEPSAYIDTPLVSIAYIGQSFLQDLYLFIMQTSGFGVYTRLYSLVLGGGFETGIMFKVDDNWRGSPEFGSISPDQGEQESTLVDIEILCVNTTFTTDGVNDIIFIPEDGLTVKNITVKDDTTVEFDLEIAADAPLGQRSVTVTYGNPPSTVTGNAVFEVLERTN